MSDAQKKTFKDIFMFIFYYFSELDKVIDLFSLYMY